MNQILNKIKKELNENVDKKYKEGATNFFKENVKIIGVRSSVVRRIAKKYFKEIKNLKKEEIFYLCEELFKSGYNEEETIAINWAYQLKEKYTKEDFYVFESWLKNYISNWASCDDFCTHNIGYLILKHPEFINDIKSWAKSNNRWLRRSSAVNLIYSIKKKKNLDVVFDIANILLSDKDDLVQKGYGWMLKEASKFYQKEVFDYVIKNKDKMPRTALRYSIEKMSKELRIKAMQK